MVSKCFGMNVIIEAGRSLLILVALGCFDRYKIDYIRGIPMAVGLDPAATFASGRPPEAQPSRAPCHPGFRGKIFGAFTLSLVRKTPDAFTFYRVLIFRKRDA